MKKHIVAIAFAAGLISTSAMAAARQTDPGMPGMSDVHDAKPADVHGAGVVKAIDMAKGTIMLQHEAIAAIGWPAMTMPFRLASPELLKDVKVGEKVQFTLRQAGMVSTVTSITQAKPSSNERE